MEIPILISPILISVEDIQPQSNQTLPNTRKKNKNSKPGLIPREGSFPLKKSFNNCWIFGILVDPPTKTIS